MKRVMKYMLMLLAVATVGLSEQAWGNGSAQSEATETVQSVAQAADADIDVGESLMNFVEGMGFVGLIQDLSVINISEPTRPHYR